MEQIINQDSFSQIEPPELFKNNPDILQYQFYNYGEQYIDPYIQNPFQSIQFDIPNFSTTPIKVEENPVVDFARQFLNTKYVYGGSNPKTGFDCSGLIQYSYKQFGINLPRTSLEMRKVGRHVDLADVKPGDIICMNSSQSPSGSHVKMVSKVNNGQIWTIEAKGKAYGIKELPLKSTKNIVDIRRVTDGRSNNKGKFNSREQFTNTLINTYRIILKEYGLDPRYSYMLTAQDASESGWGKHIIGSYNYGNITSKNGVYNRETGLTLRNFNSLEDYIRYKIELLSNNRYNFFNTFKPTSNVQIAMQTLANRGYAPGNTTYGSLVQKVYNMI